MVARRAALIAARTAIDIDQTASDADQTASDADQTASDADQTASDADERASLADQSSSDADQATTDREEDRQQARKHDAASIKEHEAARAHRSETSKARHATSMDRGRTAATREPSARGRDAVAALRDERASLRDRRAAALERSIAEIDAIAAKKLAAIREQAAADRAEAALDRARAADDRATAARQRSRLKAELEAAHLDDLTGAYRRDMGRLVLSHEIDRARRGDGRFVLAFIDVDDLKGINDRDGHAAGDRVLQTAVSVIRDHLRTFDPILRYGGDEFVAGLGGTDLVEADRRFKAIRQSLMKASGIGISVGLAHLKEGETADELMARADASLLRRRRNSRHEASHLPARASGRVAVLAGARAALS